MKNFQINSKNSIFVHFLHFWGKETFFKKIWLSGTTKHGPLTPCRVSEKTNDQIPRKLLDRRTEGWTDPNSWDPATAGGPKKR